MKGHLKRWEIFFGEMTESGRGGQTVAGGSQKSPGTKTWGLHSRKEEISAEKKNKNGGKKFKR